MWRLLNGQAPLGGEPAFNAAENALATAIANTSFSLTNPQKDAFVANTAYATSAIKSSLKDALLAVKTDSIEENLEAVKTSYDRKRARSIRSGRISCFHSRIRSAAAIRTDITPCTRLVQEK